LFFLAIFRSNFAISVFVVKPPAVLQRVCFVATLRPLGLRQVQAQGPALLLLWSMSTRTGGRLLQVSPSCLRFVVLCFAIFFVLWSNASQLLVSV
jgi:hypothetical protein